MRLRRWVRDNGLALFFGAIFLIAITAQSFVGWADYNEQRQTQGREEVAYGRYITSSSFAVDVTENWQSEYLQFLLYIVATVWLVQRGSPESKLLDDVGRGTDEDQEIGKYASSEAPRWAAVGGIRTAVYSRSLALWMG